MAKPSHDMRNAAGCYGLILIITLMIAFIAALALKAPAKREATTEMSASSSQAADRSTL